MITKGILTLVNAGLLLHRVFNILRKPLIELCMRVEQCRHDEMEQCPKLSERDREREKEREREREREREEREREKERERKRKRKATPAIIYKWKKCNLPSARFSTMTS